MNNSNTKNHPLGILLCIAAILAVSILAGFVKVLSKAGLATQEVIFFQSVVSLIVLLPWVLSRGTVYLIPKNKVLVICRAFIGLTFLYLFYLSVRLVPLVNAMLLRNTGPLFIPILVFLAFKKKIGLKVLASIAIGFIGVILVLDPGRGFLRPGDLIALSAGFTSACGTVLVGYLEDKGELVPAMMFYYIVTTLVVTGICSVHVWKTPQGILWLYLALAGIFYAVYQVLFLLALKYSSAVVISPFIFLGVVFSGVVDWIGWRQTPEFMTVIGSIVVVTGAVLATVHHSKCRTEYGKTGR